MLVGVDVDEVCADLIGEWLNRYNKDWNDSLTKEDITEWDMAKQTKAGKEIYDYLRQPDLYPAIKPIKGALDAVKQLRADGHRVVFVSSCVVGQTDAKMRWLIDNGFMQDLRCPDDFVAAHDKSIINVDLLVDDHVKNVEAFPRAAYLVSCPHNSQIKSTRDRVPGLWAVPYRLQTLANVLA